MRATRLTLSITIVLSAIAGTCVADIVAAMGTIESVDPANHTISVRRKTGKGEKAGTFKLSDDTKVFVEGDDSGIDALNEGDSVKLTYDTTAKQVTRIETIAVKSKNKTKRDDVSAEEAKKAVDADKVRVYRDLPYAEPKNEQQMLDVYAPADGNDHPVVFWIHGGGLDHGDKSDLKEKPRAFVNRGFLFVSTNYRLLPKVTTREIARDIAKSIRWVHDHAEEYGGDPDKIFVMGYAAGALLSALVCTDERYLKGEGLSFSIIKGCVPLECDAYDVRLQFLTGDRQVKQSYTKIFGAEGQQREMSPITYVAKGRRIPPFLILHVADSPEMATQAQRFVKKLHAAGIPANVYPARGTDHGTLNSNLGRPSDEPTKAMVDFLNSLLKSDSDSGKNGGS